MKGELRRWPAGSFSPAILLHSSPSIDALGCIPRSRRSSVGERRLLENLFLAITLVNPIPKQSNLYRYWAIPSYPNAMAQASFETQWSWIWTGNRLAWLWGSNRIVELMTIASYGAFVTPRQTGFKRGVITAAVNTSQRVRFFFIFFRVLVPRFNIHLRMSNLDIDGSYIKCWFLCLLYKTRFHNTIWWWQVNGKELVICTLYLYCYNYPRTFVSHDFATSNYSTKSEYTQK